MGNTSLDVTAHLVERVLIRCSEGLNEGSPLEIIKVREIGTHLKNARPWCWQVTVPYRCRDLMNNPATYPPGWTHRAYFSPREGNKWAKPGMGQNSDIVNRVMQENARAKAVARKQQEDERLQQAVIDQEAAAQAWDPLAMDLELEEANQSERLP